MFLAVHHQPAQIFVVEHSRDMHTLSLLKLLHSNVATKHIPVVLCSPAITLEHIALNGVTSNLYVVTATVEDCLREDLVVDRGPKGSLISPALKMSTYFVDVAKAYEGLRGLTKGLPIDSLKKGATIFSFGNQAEELYYVYSGQALTISSYGSADHLVNGVFCTGDFFGTMALLTAGKRVQVGLAAQDSRLIRIPKARFYHAINANIEFGKGLAAWMTRYAHEVQYHAHNVIYGQASKRMAHALVRLHRKTQLMYIDLPRADLAALTGMAKETVVRTLTSFKKSGLIDVVKKRIYLKNVPELLEMSR